MANGLELRLRDLVTRSDPLFDSSTDDTILKRGHPALIGERTAREAKTLQTHCEARLINSALRKASVGFEQDV